jgi:hydroxymethylpyrimidine/phosphomethylpyrimidine kinase
MRTALTIAGSDPGGGAGIQADLKTFAALGVYGMSAVTAITVQNTKGVVGVSPLAADLVRAQIAAIAGDIAIHATKVGMLATAAIVEAVAGAILQFDLPLVVVDPVLVSTSGERLLDEDGVRVLRAELLPRALVVTPNIPEAAALAGILIRSADDIREAARRIYDMGPSAVIITGGHAPRPDTGGPTPDVVDLLFDGNALYEFRTPRIETRHTHGTGCTFASAVAATLALGRPLPEAARLAQQYVAGAIAHGIEIGHGRGSLNHFWQRP